VTGLKAPTRLEQGAEMGRFNMGSTVILLMPPGTTEWATQLAAGTTIRVGQPLAQITV
jgi:phosphatidylserine decarboxylase